MWTEPTPFSWLINLYNLIQRSLCYLKVSNLTTPSQIPYSSRGVSKIANLCMCINTFLIRLSTSHNKIICFAMIMYRTISFWQPPINQEHPPINITATITHGNVTNKTGSNWTLLSYRKRYPPGYESQTRFLVSPLIPG